MGNVKSLSQSPLFVLKSQEDDDQRDQMLEQKLAQIFIISFCFTTDFFQNNPKNHQIVGLLLVQKIVAKTFQR